LEELPASILRLEDKVIPVNRVSEVGKAGEELGLRMK